MKICFVPTIVKGVNDHQIGDIIRLAIENIDVVSAISFQPVAFTGRIARHELSRKRFTLSDFAHAVQQPDRHLRSVRGLVPAGLRHAVLQAGERVARRADDAPVAAIRIARSAPTCSWIENKRRVAGHTVRGHRRDAAGDGQARPQGGEAAPQAVFQSQRLELDAEALPPGPRAGRPDLPEIPADSAGADGQAIRTRTRPRRKASRSRP